MFFKHISLTNPSSVVITAAHKILSALYRMSQPERSSFEANIKQDPASKDEAAVKFVRSILEQSSFLKDTIPAVAAVSIPSENLDVFIMGHAKVAADELSLVRQDRSMRSSKSTQETENAVLNKQTHQQITQSPVFLDVMGIALMDPTDASAELEAQLMLLYQAQSFFDRVTYVEPKNDKSHEMASMEYFLDVVGIVMLKLITDTLEVKTAPQKKRFSFGNGKDPRLENAKAVVKAFMKMSMRFFETVDKSAKKGVKLPIDMNLMTDMFYIKIGTQLGSVFSRLGLTGSKYKAYSEMVDRCTAFLGTPNYKTDSVRPFPSLITISSVYQNPSPDKTALPPLNLLLAPQLNPVYGDEMKSVFDLDRDVSRVHKDLVTDYYLDCLKAFAQKNPFPILPDAPTIKLKPASKPDPVIPRRNAVQNGCVTPQRPSRKVPLRSPYCATLLKSEQLERDAAAIKTKLNALSTASIAVKLPFTRLPGQSRIKAYAKTFLPVFDAFNTSLRHNKGTNNATLKGGILAARDVYDNLCEALNKKPSEQIRKEIVDLFLSLNSDLAKFARCFDVKGSPISRHALKQLTEKLDRTQIPGESSVTQHVIKTLDFDEKEKPVEQTNSPVKSLREQSATNPFDAFNNPFVQPDVKTSTPRPTEKTVPQVAPFASPIPFVTTPAHLQLSEFLPLEEESDTEECIVAVTEAVPDDRKLNGSFIPEPDDEYNEELTTVHENSQTPDVTERKGGADSGYKSIDRYNECITPEPSAFEDLFVISSDSNIHTPLASPARPVQRTASPVGREAETLLRDTSSISNETMPELPSADDSLNEDLASLITEVSVPDDREEGVRVETPSAIDDAGFPFDEAKIEDGIQEELSNIEPDADVLSLDESVDLSPIQEVELPHEVMPTSYESLMDFITNSKQFAGEIETSWNSRVNGDTFSGWIGTEIKALNSKSKNSGFTGLSKAVLAAKKDEFGIKNKSRLKQFRLSPPTQQKINNSSFLKFLNTQSTEAFLQGLEQMQVDSLDLKKGIEILSLRQLELEEHTRYFNSVLKHINEIPEGDRSDEILKIQKWVEKQSSDIKSAVQSLEDLSQALNLRQKRIQKAYSILSMSDLSLKEHQIKMLEKYKSKQASVIDVLRVFSSTIPDWVLKRFPELELHVELARALSPSSNLNKMRSVVAFNTKKVTTNKFGPVAANKLLLLCEKHHQRELVEKLIPGIDSVLEGAVEKRIYDERMQELKQDKENKAVKAKKASFLQKKADRATSNKKKVDKLKRSGLRLH